MAVGDLTTLANVKAWLGVSQAADDTLLARLITAASTFIATYLSTDILSGSHTVTRDGPGGSTFITRHTPITAVASVTIDGVSIPASSGVGVSGYRFTGSKIIVEGYRFTKGYGNVTIVYTAGFATVPPDIEQAAIELISLRYKERDRIGHVSKSLAGETVTFMIKDMPESVRAVLNQYARVTPV